MERVVCLLVRVDKLLDVVCVAFLLIVRGGTRGSDYVVWK